jgi:signal transduction histidine kinase
LHFYKQCRIVLKIFCLWDLVVAMKRPEISFSREVLLMFVLAVGILLALGAMIYRNFDRQDNSNWWVAHTQEVLSQTKSLVADVAEMEASIRDYAITHDTAALNFYESHQQQLSKDYAHLKWLTRDNANPELAQNHLHSKLLYRLNKLQLLLQAARDPMSPQERSIKVADMVRQGRESRQMLQKEIVIIEEGERRLLTNRLSQAKLINSQTRLSFNIGLGISLLLLALCFFRINRESLYRSRAEQEQHFLNEALEKQVDLLRNEVDERQKAEQQVIVLNEQLQTQVENLDTLNNSLSAVNRELEAFSYSVSHDLRAPLRSIDGFSQALLDFYNDQLDEDGRDYLNRIRNNSQRMAQLIDDMLQLSRLTRSEMRIEPVNLSNTAKELSEELKRQDPQRQVLFDLSNNQVVQGDKSLLYALLQNLLANAWKFTSKHEQAKITFGSYEDAERPKNQQTVYYVKDDGAGFEMEFVHKLFGAFQRLHGMTQFSGTGIGLATAQRIVHRHGGQIWAEGAVEQGATFFFTLPTAEGS